VLTDAVGSVLGVLPAFPVEVPWWQEAWPVVDGARERFGIDVTNLRILVCSDGATHGGAVTYLAEVGPALDARTLPLEAWPRPLEDDPQRMPWARPGGPAADLAWAETVLDDRGMVRTGAPRQIRTWNLSSLWTLPLADGTNAWLKAVPPFFAHEGAVLEHLAGPPVPPLIDRDGYRTLMPELPGDDQYDATRPGLDRMIDALVAIQVDEAAGVDALLALGLPDWRGPALTGALRDLIKRRSPELGAADRSDLARFADDLPRRFGAAAASGLPDTLVHGDFHPGNTRSDHGRDLVILDWGDCGVGHPLLDEPAFLHDRPHLAGDLRAYWHERWLERFPDSDPDRASRLLRPVAAARQALIYQGFLDHIEATEQPYHRHDVPFWLQRTAALVRDEGGSARSR
jgi:hypothetical protein